MFHPFHVYDISLQSSLRDRRFNLRYHLDPSLSQWVNHDTVIGLSYHRVQGVLVAVWGLVEVALHPGRHLRESNVDRVTCFTTI